MGHYKQEVEKYSVFLNDKKQDIILEYHNIIFNENSVLSPIGSKLLYLKTGHRYTYSTPGIVAPRNLLVNETMVYLESLIKIYPQRRPLLIEMLDKVRQLSSDVEAQKPVLLLICNMKHELDASMN